MDGRMDIWVVDMDGWIDGYQWLDTAITGKTEHPNIKHVCMILTTG